MKRSHIALLLCVLLLSTLLMGVGYATLTTTLAVEGSTRVDPPKIVFISRTSVTSGTVTGVSRSGTVLRSQVTLANSASSQAVIRVTVKNNTEYPYTFNGVTYTVGADTYDNTAIAVSTSISKGLELAAGASTEFDLIFKYKSGVSTNKVLNSVLNLSFVPAAEYIPEIAVKGSLGRFEQVLNDEVTFDQLETALNASSDRYNDNSYIGNVVGANTADSKALNELFTVDGYNYLTLEIEGEETNVTALIKHEDIGGTTDKEMVIYMTGETISGSLFRPSNIQVFAAIYRKNAEGNWVQIGQLYEGTAKSNNYKGELFGTHNSFNTDTWETVNAYHGVAAGATVNQLLAAIPTT